MEVLKGEQTIVELSQHCQIQPRQITGWKKQLLDHIPDIYSKDSKDRKPEQGPSVKDLYAKIGQLSASSDESEFS